MTSTPADSSARLTRVQWLICIIAVIGFAFDTYELLMLPLILRPALEQLGGLAFGTPEYTRWRDLMFYVPAVCGGVFGLLGGYLTDRLGRRRILTWSILLYAFSALGAGFATSLPMLLVLRTGQTDRKLAQAKLTTLDRLPVRLIGAVLNDIQAEGMYKYYAYLDGYGTLDEDEEPRLVQAGGGGSSLPARRN